MNYKGLIAVCDFDSACVASGNAVDIMEAERTLHKYYRRVTDVLEPSRVIGFVESIDGKCVFRKQVATTIPYKHTRRNKEKPPFTDEAKMMARSKYGMHHCERVEAEDAVSITVSELGIWNCVKACIDKDMLTTPGLFFNYYGTKWKLPHYTEIDEYVIKVSEEQADRNLHIQILSGDTDDSIPGCRGIGVGTADKLLAGVPQEALSHHVASIYKERGYSYEYLLEQSRLVRILRSRWEVFTIISREEFDNIKTGEDNENA